MEGTARHAIQDGAAQQMLQTDGVDALPSIVRYVGMRARQFRCVCGTIVTESDREGKPKYGVGWRGAGKVWIGQSSVMICAKCAVGVRTLLNRIHESALSEMGMANAAQGAAPDESAADSEGDSAAAEA